jgi:hypothetical protein
MVCKDHSSYCLNTDCVKYFFTDCTPVASGKCNDWCHCVYYHSSENEVKLSSLIITLTMSINISYHIPTYGVSAFYVIILELYFLWR